MAVQTNGNDCGVYAIAYATALCLRASPAKLLFDEIVMRPHLSKRLEDGWFTVSDKENMQEDDSESSMCWMPSVDGAAIIECSDCGE